MRLSSATLDDMITTDKFTVSEAAFRAVIETVVNMNAAVIELSRQCEAANEAIVILHHELVDIREVMQSA